VWKNWLWAYKTSNISKTVEDRAKVTISLTAYIKPITVHGLSIVAKTYDLECHKINEIQLSNDSDAM